MPNQVTTGFGTCKAGPVQNNRSTIPMAQGVGTDRNSPTLETLLNQVPYYGSQLVASVSPASSGNVGHGTIGTGVKFGYQNPSFVMSKVTTTIGGNANTLTQSMAGDTSSRRPVGRAYAYTRQQILSFDIYHGSGVSVKGSNNGVDVLMSGIDGTTGFYADRSTPRGINTVPSKFTFMYGAPTASGMSPPRITQP